MTPVRPVFNDGAILGADDLDALAVIDRDRAARHARHLHTPGVGAGLALRKEERSTTAGVAYIDVTLERGYALDGTGRELVVAQPLPVSPDRFLGDNPNPPTMPGEQVTVWHPMFIRGFDATATATNGPVGCEAASGPGRVEEDVEVEFGRPGDAGADQPVPEPDAGPGSGSWRVLVGFVRLDTSIGRFVEAESLADGVRVQPAGVRAGLVAGHDGRVEIRPRPAGTSGVPAMVVDEADGGSLVFGLHSGSGAVKPLMTVDASGNLTVEGTVKGVLTSGAVLVVAGAAFDGTVLPLPDGVEPEDVDTGAVDIALHLTPRLPDPSGAPTPGQLFLPVECSVDDERRVTCRGEWFNPGIAGSNAASAACNYLVVVSVPQGGAP
jgi:hypothetical protein